MRSFQEEPSSPTSSTHYGRKYYERARAFPFSDTQHICAPYVSLCSSLLVPLGFETYITFGTHAFHVDAARSRFAQISVSTMLWSGQVPGIILTCISEVHMAPARACSLFLEKASAAGFACTPAPYGIHELVTHLDIDERRERPLGVYTITSGSR